MSAEGFIEEFDTETIEELVESYHELSTTERNRKNEAQTRQQFITPLIAALGWDITTDQVKPEQRTLVGDADYALSLNGREQYFVEAKRLDADLDGERRLSSDETQSYVEQAVDYAWHQGCDWAVLTNFAELRLYFTHVSKDNIEDGHVFTITADEYLTDDGLAQLAVLSKPAIKNNILETLERARERDNVNNEVLNTLSNARVLLTRDLYDQHPELGIDQLREDVQRILDRLVVMRVAEDRGVIPADSLYQMMEAWKNTAINPEQFRLIGDLKNRFRGFDSVYNSELFAEHPCEDRNVSNEPLKTIINSLYEYNFAYISADVLGTIYEDYLGHAIEESSEAETALELVEQASARRESGIYYTPVPVVEYIVESTLGDRIDELMEGVREELSSDNPDFEAARETFDRIENIRFLDVSCGSGSFLIKAYDQFVEAYEEFDTLSRQARSEGMEVTEYTGAELIPTDYRKKILRNNIFGVDLDFQATEIAAVNLVLKALREGEELPKILQQNLRCGNSLLNGPVDNVAAVLGVTEAEAERLGAFDWRSEFDHVFGRNGDGFTVIAGNPPWGADMEAYREWLEYDDHYALADGQYDSYELFIELSTQLLEDNGTLGFIVPDSILREEHTALRELLTENYLLDQVHKLGEGVFDDVYSGAAIIQYTNSPSDPEHDVKTSVLRKEDRERMEGAGGEALASLIQQRQHIKPQSRVLEEEGCNFRVFAGEEDYEVMEIIESDTLDTENVLRDGRGDEIGKDGNIMRCPNCMEWDTYPRSRAASKGGGYYPKTCTHCGHEYEFEQAVETRTIIEDENPGGWKPVYFGEHVVRYRIAGSAFIDDSVDGIDFEDESLFEPPKMLVRKTGFGFNATIERTNGRTLQVVFVFRTKDNRDAPYDRYDLEYFLGLLCSRVMLYYFTKERSEIEWQSYPYKTQGLIMGLPYPEINWDDDEEVELYNEFVDLVEEATRSDAQIDHELDMEIEQLVFEFYDIPPEKRQRVWDELDELQALQVVRELFPNRIGDDVED